MTDRPRAPASLVGAAFLMTFSSAFGQTYFIAIFAPWLKADLGLTDGGFGMLFTLGTLASACVVVWAGKFADRVRIRWLGVGALVALGAAAAAMATVTVAWVLLPVLFALRLLGQGSMGHLAVTGVGRWYVRRRGRMLSIAMLGFPVSEAILPITAVLLIGAIGWRETWLAGAAMLCLVSAPLVLFLLRREPAHDQPPADWGGEPPPDRHHWTRAEVVRRPEFFAIVVGIVAPPFVMTGVFFHQAYLVELKGWTLAWFVGWMPVFALVAMLTALATGWMIDRFGARRVLPFYLLPMAGAVLVLTAFESRLAVPVFMAVSALTTGSGGTLAGALWAELFGTRHLGAIRSVAFSMQVVASAVAPGLIGVLLDLGVPLEAQYLAMVGYALIATVWLKISVPRLDLLAATPFPAGVPAPPR